MKLLKDDLRSLGIKAIVFVANSVFMSVEISASRVLAPYFGNTIFVWASLISVLLGALACGYYFGGRLSDKRPSRVLLGYIIGLAGISILGIPFISSAVNKFIAGSFIGYTVGPLFACAIIFFLPGVLLGMVSPFAVKFNTQSISKLGNTAGNIYAVSAIGSIFGTLFTAFYLINKIRVSAIFTLLGLTLVITSVFIIAAGARQNRYSFIVALIVLALLLAVVPAPLLVNLSQGETVVFQDNSFYNFILVTDNRLSGIRRLRFDKNDQTAIYLNGNHESAVSYTDMLHLPVAFSGQLKDVLFIGAGGAVVPRNFYWDYPGIEIDLVEIDPSVVSVSKKFFYFTEYPRLKVFIDDGRRFVKNSAKKYDLVIIDVFNTRGMIPFYMLTQEFLSQVRQILNPAGAVAFNIINPAYNGDKGIFLPFYKTMQSVFENTYAFADIRPNENIGYKQRINIIVIATTSKERLSREDLYNKFQSLECSGKVKILNFAKYAKQYLDVDSLSLSGVTVFTDDFVPVESLSWKDPE